MANSSAFKSSPVFLRVQKTYTALHLNLLAVDRWELINKDMVWRAQDVRRKLASEVEYLVQFANDDNEAVTSLAVDATQVLVRSFINHDGAMGHEHTLAGVKHLGSLSKTFDQALIFYFDVASSFLENARSRYQMKLLVERDVVQSYDNTLHHLIAQHYITMLASKSQIVWSPAWAIHKVEWFRLEFEERYDGLLSAFGGRTLFKDPYLRKTHRLLVRIQRRATAEMAVVKAIGHLLPQELVDYVAEFLYDDAELAETVGLITRPPSTL